MSDTPERRYWQIHLSTAIILMFVGGSLLWANCSSRTTDLGPVVRGDSLSLADDLRMYMYEYGWPWTAYTRDYGFYRESGHKPWSIPFALANSAVALVLTTGLILICEFWIGRRRV